MNQSSPQPLEPNQYQQPLVTQKSSLSGFIVVILVVMVATIAFLVYQNFAMSKRLDTLMSGNSTTFVQPSPTQSRPPSVTPSPTPSGKSVIFEEIQFAYPTDWEWFQEGFSGIRPANRDKNNPYPAIMFSFYDNPDNLTVKQFDDKKRNEGKIWNTLYYSNVASESDAQEVLLGKTPGYFLKNQNCEPLPCDLFSFTHNKKVYVLTDIYASIKPGAVMDRSQEAGFKEVFQKVISSLAFK